MYILFKTKKLEKEFNDHRLLQRKYGTRAKAIQRRMAVLSAAGNLSMVPKLPPERCHELSGKKKGVFAVDIAAAWRLLFQPNEPVPKLSDGGIDLRSVNSITIIGVEDYH